MGSSGPDEDTPGLPGREPATQPTPVQPGYQPTYVPTRRPEAETVPPAPGADVTARPPVPDAAPQSPTIVVRRQPEAAAGPGEPVTYRPTPDSTPPSAGPPQSAPDVLRYGPGVPAGQAGVAARACGVPATGPGRLRARVGCAGCAGCWARL